MTKKENMFFIECALVFVFLLLPPLFSAEPFTLPPKPEGLYARCTFCFYTTCAAAYEEILYRLYTPNRLNRIYTAYIKPKLRGTRSESEPGAQAPLPFLSTHLCKSITIETLRHLVFTEFSGLLLFTLAHRYLGIASMLFAAGAGVVFRIAYLKLKCLLHPAASIAAVAAVHSLWNIEVYYYLWGDTLIEDLIPSLVTM